MFHLAETYFTLKQAYREAFRSQDMAAYVRASHDLNLAQHLMDAECHVPAGAFAESLSSAN